MMNDAHRSRVVGLFSARFTLIILVLPVSMHHREPAAVRATRGDDAIPAASFQCSLLFTPGLLDSSSQMLAARNDISR